MAKGQWEVQGIVDALKRAGVRITYEMVRRYTLGQAMPRPEKMGQLAGILGVSPSFLQYGSDSETPSPPSKPSSPKSERRAGSGFYPFLRILPEDYAALDDDAKDDIESIIELRIDKAARNSSARKRASNRTGTEDA
ncbi:hypothetical protein DK459_11960 [Achromobacter sp. RW408]|nr:hypothetical protein DK459_11960 [Achromobacter sp. RW408]